MMSLWEWKVWQVQQLTEDRKFMAYGVWVMWQFIFKHIYNSETKNLFGLAERDIKSGYHNFLCV